MYSGKYKTENKNKHLLKRANGTHLPMMNETHTRKKKTTESLTLNNKQKKKNKPLLTIWQLMRYYNSVRTPIF